jgi:hypothetical protein
MRAKMRGMQAIVLHGTLTSARAWDWRAALLQALPYAKRMQLEDRDTAARNAGLAGIALALLGVERLSIPCGNPSLPRMADLAFPLDAKPAFAMPPYFSISHSALRVCCALSPDADLGIDMEMFDCTGGKEARQRLQTWTAIEATLKAAGHGLRHAESVSVRPDLTSAALAGTVYAVQPVPLAPDCVCHLAAVHRCKIETEFVDLASEAVSTLLQDRFGLGAQRG